MNNDDGSGMGWEPSDPLCADPLCADPLCASRPPFTHNPQPTTDAQPTYSPPPSHAQHYAPRATRYAHRSIIAWTA